VILGIWGTWPVRWALIGPTRYVVPLFTYGERELGESVMGGAVLVDPPFPPNYCMF